MANRDAPSGFGPAHGVGVAHQYRIFPVDVANATALFVGDVVDFDPNGGVIPAAADAGVSAAGVCVAVLDTNFVTCGHPNSAVSTFHLTASTRGYAIVALAIPGAVFKAQVTTATTPSENDIGATGDHVAGSGNTTFGRSQHEVDIGGGGLQFRIIGLVDSPDNDWAQHAKVYVVFNESALGTSAAASV